MKKVLASLALGAALVALAACEPAVRVTAPGRSPASSAIAVTRDDRTLLVAAEDHDQLLVIDRATKQVKARIDVGDAPTHVIELADGTAAVTDRYDASVAIVDVKTGTVLKTIAVGVEPYGLVELSPGRLAVALAGDARVAVVNVAQGGVERLIDLADRDPRAVALLADGTLYVSHMATGHLSRVDVDAGTATLVDIATRNDFGPQLRAEHLRSLTVDAERNTVLIAHTQANESTVRAPIGEPGDLPPGGGGECGYGGCPAELGAVVPGITEVDEDTNVVIVPQPDMQQNTGFNGAMEDCFDCGRAAFGGAFTPNPPSVLNPFEQRFVGTQLSNPAALALFDGGRGQLVVNLGSKNAVMLRRDLKGVATDVIGTVKLGNGAQSVAISQDGQFAYVWNQFDASVSEIQLPQIDDDVATQTKFVPDASGTPVASAELGVVPEFAAVTFAVAEDALPREASIGRKMFHDATDARISANGTVSCASCHPDGRNDGRTWQFVFGPRNTPQLGGGILDSAPFHWPGDVATVADLNNMTVLPFMGGTGLDPNSFTFVAAFIDTIRAAPAAAELRDYTEQELRGQEIFESEATKCSTCHQGSHLTDNKAWDVGSKKLGNDIALFQTPVLHGLARSAPYLHDGSAATLKDVVNQLVVTDKMGVGSHLNATQVDDLVAYLQTL